MSDTQTVEQFVAEASQETPETTAPETVNDVAEDSSPSEEVAPEQKKKNDAQTRIRELVAKTKDLENRWNEERIEKQRILQLMEQKIQPQEQAKPDLPPNPADYTDRPYEDYISDLTDYKTRQVIAAERQRSVQEQQQAAVRTQIGEQVNRFAEEAKKARERYPDFSEVVDSATPPQNPVVAASILGCDNPADVAYYLHKNPSELAKIQSLPPLIAAREIGKIDARYTPVKATHTTKAPSPIPQNNNDYARQDFSDIDAWMKARNAGKI